MSEGWLTAASLLAVVALVFANGFFVASEFALVAIRRSRVDELVAKGQTVVERVRPMVSKVVGNLRARFGRK